MNYDLKIEVKTLMLEVLTKILAYLDNGGKLKNLDLMVDLSEYNALLTEVNAYTDLELKELFSELMVDVNYIEFIL